MSYVAGYNKLGNETTAHRTDWREQIDISTPHPVPLPSEPLYRNLLAPNLWPSPELLPSFRPTFERYISVMSTLSTNFTSLIAEALGLPADAFDRFFERDQQHKLKVVRYPDIDELDPASADDGPGPRLGVGPHKDSMLSSYLLQASPHRGLQAQNLNGEWVDCPPLPGTLVVAIGQGLEALTHGACASTTHRVLSPARGEGARYSIPFFQGVSYDGNFDSVDIPEEVREEKRQFVDRIGGERRDDVEFTFVKGRWCTLGEATLWNRCKSHPDVAERWYPEILAQIRAQNEKEMAAAANGTPEANRVGVSSSARAIEAH
jgi:isopenicillin N synthase-like dioxygenase